VHRQEIRDLLQLALHPSSRIISGNAVNAVLPSGGIAVSQITRVRGMLRDRATITMVATYLVIGAAGWYLLKELATVLRPLLLAVFLAYIIVPVQAGLARNTSRVVGFVLLGLVVAGACVLLAALTARSAADLAADLPKHTERAKEIIGHFRAMAERWPWLAELTGDTDGAADVGGAQLGKLISTLAGTAADVLGQAMIAGVYLFFLLLEAANFPARIRAGFDPAQAANVLAVVDRINTAIAGYLRAKVLSSVVLAVPAVIVLWSFGVKSALLWGVLTFLFNFVPYVGSAITWTGPTLLAFLTLEPGWRPVTVGGLLLADHLLSANLIEPALTGKAVDLSPLVVLLALAFWGSCWGLEGMLLAVPLTVVLRIVMDNLPATRPIARLMGVG
jgi:AI-2 transport protein TqsA